MKESKLRSNISCMLDIEIKFLDGAIVTSLCKNLYHVICSLFTSQRIKRDNNHIAAIARFAFEHCKDEITKQIPSLKRAHSFQTSYKATHGVEVPHVGGQLFQDAKATAISHNRVFATGNNSDLRIALVTKQLLVGIFIAPFESFINQDMNNKADADLRRLRFEIHGAEATTEAYNLATSSDPADQQTIRQSIDASAAKAARKVIRTQQEKQNKQAQAAKNKNPRGSSNKIPRLGHQKETEDETAKKTNNNNNNNKNKKKRQSNGPQTKEKA